MPDLKRCLVFSELLTVFEHELKVLFASMLPIIEVRGAIPIGLALGMNVYHAAVVAYIGSILPVPVIILAGRKIVVLISRWKPIRLIAERIIGRTTGKYEITYNKFGSWALLLFVAIPLPGTGVWAGSLIASILRLRLKWSVIAILVGNAIATAIIAATGYGIQRMLN